MMGVFGTAVALPFVDSPSGSAAAGTASPSLDYEGVTVSTLGTMSELDTSTTLQRLVVQPALGEDLAVASLLNDLGAEPLREVEGMIEVAVPPTTAAILDQSPLVAALGPLQQAHEPGPAASASVGDYTRQATALASGPLALGSIGVTGWQDAGYTGAGVTMALIDTGFASWEAAEAAGRVPTVAPGDDHDYCDNGFSARTHGTATAEVAYAVSPGVRLVRVCIDDAMDLAAATTALIARGDIDIINMALGFYNTGPGDGTGGPGSPDESVRRALAADLVWVNSAGNEAPLHYAGPFVDLDGDGLHNYSGGDERGQFTVPAGSDVEIFLRWNEWGGAVTPPADGFRLCFSVQPDAPLSCLESVQPERATPTTGVALSNRRAEPVTFHVAISRVRGSGAPHMDLFFTDAVDWEYPIPSSSLVDPAAVHGVVAVGAACADTGIVQSASSHGPTLDGRPGISLVAPGATRGELFGASAECPGGFGGTSAAAPYAAGALALLKQSDPGASSVDLVDQLLTRTAAASDPGAPGTDPVYGAGVLSLGNPPPFGPAPMSALDFVVSTRSDRSDAVPLDRQVLTGGPFIWLAPLFPDPAPTRVEFYIDDVLVNVEVTPTLDVGGGLPEQSFPVDTTRWTDGRHRLTAVITRADGSREHAVASLLIDNRVAVAPAVAGLLSGPDGGGLHRSNVAADAVVTLQPVPELAGNIDHVRFFVDAVFVGLDSEGPYQANLAHVAGLRPGQHMIRAVAVTRQGALWPVDANFSVGPPLVSRVA